MKQHPSLQVFLSKLIDYAGLFPPASLPLKNAVENYATYINSNDHWMLGPFIIAAMKINELDEYADLFTSEKPLKLSVVGRKSESENECIMGLKEDLKAISDRLTNWSTVEAYEIPLPLVIPTQGLLNELSASTQQLGLNVFCEVTVLKNDNWQKHLSSSLNAIAACNAVNIKKLGVKLRTGGIKAEMIPNSEQVSFVIASCRDRNLPIKFTAGLHHPIRMYRKEVHAKMHGFLNIFLAGMLAYQLNLSEKQLEEIISDEDSRHFTIAPDRLSWKNLQIDSQEIKRLRESLCSFGSCNFDEPKDELMELSNVKESMK